jgi:hypothetical protein
MALSVPLSRFTLRVGGGSAFFVRPIFVVRILVYTIIAGAVTVSRCRLPANVSSNDLTGGWTLVSMSMRPQAKVSKASPMDGKTVFHNDGHFEAQLSWREFSDRPPLLFHGTFSITGDVLVLTEDQGTNISHCWFENNYLVLKSDGTNAPYFYYRRQN